MNPDGVSYRIAVPETAVGGSPYDVIIQVTVPTAIGWAGLAWGGGMTYNPLTIVWKDGNQVMFSPRLA